MTERMNKYFTVTGPTATVTKDILLTREVVNRSIAHGLFDSPTGILIVETWAKVETSTPGNDEEARARLFARLLGMQFGRKGKEYTKLIYKGKQSLLQEVRLKLIEKQLQKQQQDLLRSMHIIAGKQEEVAQGFLSLVREVASASTNKAPASTASSTTEPGDRIHCSAPPHPHPHPHPHPQSQSQSSQSDSSCESDRDELGSQSMQCAMALAALSTTTSVQT